MTTTEIDRLRDEAGRGFLPASHAWPPRIAGTRENSTRATTRTSIYRPVDDDDGLLPDRRLPAPTARPPRDPRTALVAIAMARRPHAARSRRGYTAGSTLALVVSVPTADWIAPVTEFFQQRPFGREVARFARDGSDRLPSQGVLGNAEVASDLAAGRSVVGIAVNPEAVLPATLVAAADQRIKVGSTGPRSFEPSALCTTKFRRASTTSTWSVWTRRCRGRDAAGRRTRATSPRGSLRRRRAAAGIGSIDDVPDLATAVEYGAAREWGLALARDMRDYRAGVLAGARWTAEPSSSRAPAWGRAFSQGASRAHARPRWWSAASASCSRPVPAIWMA